MLAVRLRQPKHLAPAKTHQCRCFGYLDPAIRQIVQHAHPVDLRPAHRNHRHRPHAPQPKLWRVTSLSGPTVTSLSGVTSCRGLNSQNERLWNDSSWRHQSIGSSLRDEGPVGRLINKLHKWSQSAGGEPIVAGYRGLAVWLR